MSDLRLRVFDTTLRDGAAASYADRRHADLRSERIGVAAHGSIRTTKQSSGRAKRVAHEAGIHQDGMPKDRRTYEIVHPRTSALQRVHSCSVNIRVAGRFESGVPNWASPSKARTSTGSMRH
jgi:hypothetical protein